MFNRRRIVLVLVFGLLIFFFISTQNWVPASVFSIILALGFFVSSNESDDELDDELSHNERQDPTLCYYGNELNFSDDILTEVLNKHFPYFANISPADRQKFLFRIKKFIDDKIFKIHDNSGFREMPILISATGIQLTFGLEEFLLPHFKYIHIYPEEFVRETTKIDFLEGNVSGQCINLSWKHFLQGFQYPDDGQNVGLHEMSHALYYQTFIAKDDNPDFDKSFQTTFDEFNNYGNKVFDQEKISDDDLYSKYALQNIQEFWAESIEIFFEKPGAMKTKYPDLYSAISDILNQDPLNKVTVLKVS